MRGGVILIVVGLLLAYLAVTGKYKCLSSVLSCLLGDGEPCGCDDAAQAAPSSMPTLQGVQPLVPIKPIRSMLNV